MVVGWVLMFVRWVFVVRCDGCCWCVMWLVLLLCGLDMIIGIGSFGVRMVYYVVVLVGFVVLDLCCVLFIV